VNPAEGDMDNVQKWNIHIKADNVKTIFQEMWPYICTIHKQYPNDVLFMDISRIHHFYVNGKVDSSRINNTNSFWTKENPFPFNSFTNDDEILSIWKREMPGTKNIIFTQLMWQIEAMIKLKNKSPENTVLVLGEYIREVKTGDEVKYPTIMTLYMLQYVKVKINPDEPFENQMVLTVEPTMIFT
jgi:hypothetical protein